MLRKIEINHVTSGNCWTSGWIEVEKIEPEMAVLSLVNLDENAVILVTKSDGGTIAIPTNVWNESVRTIEYKEKVKT